MPNKDMVIISKDDIKKDIRNIIGREKMEPIQFKDKIPVEFILSVPQEHYDQLKKNPKDNQKIKDAAKPIMESYIKKVSDAFLWYDAMKNDEKLRRLNDRDFAKLFNSHIHRALREQKNNHLTKLEKEYKKTMLAIKKDRTFANDRRAELKIEIAEKSAVFVVRVGRVASGLHVTGQRGAIKEAIELYQDIDKRFGSSETLRKRITSKLARIASWHTRLGDENAQYVEAAGLLFRDLIGTDFSTTVDGVKGDIFEYRKKLKDLELDSDACSEQIEKVLKQLNRINTDAGVNPDDRDRQIAQLEPKLKQALKKVDKINKEIETGDRWLQEADTQLETLRTDSIKNAKTTLTSLRKTYSRLLEFAG